MSFRNPDVQYPDSVALTYDSVNCWLSCVYNDHSVYVWDTRDLQRVLKVHSALYHSDSIWDLQVNIFAFSHLLARRVFSDRHISVEYSHLSCFDSKSSSIKSERRHSDSVLYLFFFSTAAQKEKPRVLSREQESVFVFIHLNDVMFGVNNISSV